MAKQTTTYADAGVNIEAGDEMVGMITKHMMRTYSPRVLGKHGAFAGMFRLDYNEKLFKRNYRDPVLVACADGVGTKVLLACEAGIHDTVGIDLVAMNVNDMIVQGAEPMFFLDYIGTSKLDPQWMTDIVKGVADGCQQAGCSLLGGETAEMPDVYGPGEYDLAGFAVGVVELHRAIDPSRVEEGDVILGLASSGIHSNGYSLVRKIIENADLNLDQNYPELGDGPLSRAVLEPTRIYVRSIMHVLQHYRVKKVISGMAHITGGGLPGNVNRALTDKVDAVIYQDRWTVPPIFDFLAERGGIEREEMMRVFNMGIGYVLIVRPTFANSVAEQLNNYGQTVYNLGEIVTGSGQVQMR